MAQRPSLAGQVITIPPIANILVGWTHKVSPDKTTATAASKEYFRLHLNDPRAAHKFSLAAFDELVNVAYPNPDIPAEKLAIATNFLMWIFHWDDVLDCGDLKGRMRASKTFVTKTCDRVEYVRFYQGGAPLGRDEDAIVSADGGAGDEDRSTKTSPEMVAANSVAAVKHLPTAVAALVRVWGDKLSHHVPKKLRKKAGTAAKAKKNNTTNHKPAMLVVTREPPTSPAREPNRHHPAITALSTFAPALQSKRISDATIDFVSVKFQMLRAQYRTSVALDEYMDLRVIDSAVPMAHFFTEYLLDLHLPDLVFDMPEMKALMREAAIIAGLANDLLSLPKDTRTEPENLTIVPLLVRAYQYSAQDAVDDAVKLIEEAYKRFVVAEDALFSPAKVLAIVEAGAPATLEQGQAIVRDLRAFVQAGKDLVMGVVYWSYETPRYMSNGEVLGDGSVRFELGD